MDVSTLFAAPTTAASTAALSFGAMGGATVQGEGVDGLDSFNQLLGNFLALTGGAMPEGAVAADGLTPVAADGTAGPALPQGAAGLLQGLNLAAPAGAGSQSGKLLEGRWAQSGLNLLAGGALAGQEMNQEVVAFLNDLTTAISAEGAPLEGEISLEVAVESVEEGGDEVATLMLAEGEVATLPVADAALPVLTAPAIIPRDAAPPAPGALGLTLTVAGTGLKALPTVPASETVAAPVATPVIPRLTAAPILPTAPKTAPVATAPTTAPVAPAPAPVIATAEKAETVEAPPPVPATGPAVTATATTSAPPAGAAAPAVVAPAADERVAAIALPAELAATALTDETPVPAAAAAPPAEPAKLAKNATPATTPAPQVAVRPAVAPVAQPIPAGPVVDSAPAQTPVMTETTAVAEPAPATPAASAAAPSTPGPVTVSATRVEAPPAATPADKVPAVKAKPVEAAELPADSAAEAPADAPDVTAAEPAAQTAHPATANVTASPTRPAATPVRPVVTPPAHAQAAASQPAPEAEAEPAEAPAEDEEATNNRMLAPRHVGSQAQAEMQDGITGQAQSAGQNQAGTRDAAPPAVNGEREDNLLARAVTAAGKTSEGHGAGDEGASGNPDTGTPAETVDGLTGTVHAGEPGKAQGTDFAQSLRQTSAPHRPGAYMPPTQQMAFHVQRAVQDGNDRLSIRLNPQELGRIDVQLEIGTEGKLRAKVMVENPQTLEMLQKDAKHLEKALQEAGLQTDQNSLSFSLQDSGDQARERQDQREQSGHGTGIASEEVEQEDPAIIAQAQIMELGRVDVRV
ncbi:flagellar hook-length control protein FliK [Niveispirillum sp. KHB5.9]|uniref:flagellar hook-length control protein FliK n=1 Tax=Niveispirillum sp. KHB5.9 TaxID=3400269 RepID=UPI003A846D5C